MPEPAKEVWKKIKKPKSYSLRKLEDKKRLLDAVKKLSEREKLRKKLAGRKIESKVKEQRHDLWLQKEKILQAQIEADPNLTQQRKQLYEKYSSLADEIIRTESPEDVVLFLNKIQRLTLSGKIKYLEREVELEKIRKMPDMEQKRFRLKKLLENREEFKTIDVLEDIRKNTKSKQQLKVIDILLSNKNFIKNSTILRGPTATDSGENGQTILEGTYTLVNPQVYIRKYNGYKKYNSKYVAVPFEESSKSIFNTTVLHELIHSYTRYITAIFEKGKEIEILSPEEITFYNTAKKLHNEYLLKHTTGNKYLDDFDEFIAKTITEPRGDDYFQEKLTKAFQKMYEKNNRKIISLSKFLRDSVK